MECWPQDQADRKSFHNVSNFAPNVNLPLAWPFNKFDEFEVFVHNEEPDIIGVSETWLHADIPYSESELKGYWMYRGDRMHRRGGGCLLYIKKTIKSKEVVIEGQYRSETVWAAIINGNKEEAVLGVVYRRPRISKE